MLEIRTGAAFFSGENSFFSWVIAWKFATGEDQFIPEIEATEKFYRQQKYEQVNIKLSPLAENYIFSVLSKREYLIKELHIISMLDLTCFNSNTAQNLNNIPSKTDDDNLEAWAHTLIIS